MRVDADKGCWFHTSSEGYPFVVGMLIDDGLCEMERLVCRYAVVSENLQCFVSFTTLVL